MALDHRMPPPTVRAEHERIELKRGVVVHAPASPATGTPQVKGDRDTVAQATTKGHHISRMSFTVTPVYGKRDERSYLHAEGEVSAKIAFGAHDLMHPHSIASRKRKILVKLPATLPPPKAKAGVLYDHSRRQITAKRPASSAALAQRRAKDKKKQTG